jgi:hypothetical protein
LPRSSVSCASWSGSWATTTRLLPRRWGKTCTSSRYARHSNTHCIQLTIP